MGAKSRKWLLLSAALLAVVYLLYCSRGALHLSQFSGEKLWDAIRGANARARPLNPFKHGFGLIAKQAAVPVQAVFIETNTRFLGKGWPFFKKPDFPLVYRIRLGERRLAGEEVKEFVAELQQYFQQECASAQNGWQPPR